MKKVPLTCSQKIDCEMCFQVMQLVAVCLDLVIFRRQLQMASGYLWHQGHIVQLAGFHQECCFLGSRQKFSFSCKNQSLVSQMVKNLPAVEEKLRFYPWVRKILWRSEWQPSPVFLPGEFHGWRNLVGYSPQGCKESDITEQLTLTLF